MHLQVSDTTVLILAAAYAALSGVFVPVMLIKTSKQDLRSTIVKGLSLVLALCGLTIVLFDILLNHVVFFASAPASRLITGVGSAASFASIAATTWISAPPEKERRARRLGIALFVLSAVFMLTLLPQAWRLASA